MIKERANTLDDAAHDSQRPPRATLLWGDSTLALVVSSLVTLVGALLCTNPYANTALSRQLYVQPLPIETTLLVLQLVFTGILALGILSYRTVRKPKQPIVNLAVAILQIGSAFVVYSITSSFLVAVFASDVHPIDASPLNFTAPSKPVMSTVWLLLAYHALAHTIRRRLPHSSRRFSPPSEVARLADDDILGLRKILRGVHTALMLLYTFSAFHLIFLVRYTSVTFSDIGAALAIGTFAFWMIVMAYNAVAIAITHHGHWPSRRRQQTFMSGYGLLLLLVLYFYANSAKLLANIATLTLFALAILLLAMSPTSTKSS